MKHLLILCVLLALVHIIFAWDNDWDQPLDFVCPSGQAVRRIESTYDTRKNDRLFKLHCANFPGTYTTCYQTDYVNWWDATFATSCPDNGVIVGAYSVHDNVKEDRRWKINCCYGGTHYYLYDCHYANSVHDWQQLHVYSVPSEYWIHGVTSNYDNGKEDRLWQYKICKIGYY